MKDEENRVKMQEEDDDRSLAAMNARLGTQVAQVRALAGTRSAPEVQ